MDLIIVESPTKSRTIQKFLGKKYKVLSSFGHIRDLPEKELGIDIENEFKPTYIIPSKAKKIISNLKKEAEKADNVILATDEDREGESIAWHLQEVLKLENPKRIVFHEITKPAIEQALKSPRQIDMNLVNAQQARRILDRIVGYKISPFLWEKIAKGLSAGRVQSVALRLIVEREREIKKFIPTEYWSIIATLVKSKYKNFKENNEFKATLIKKNNKIIDKLEIKNKSEANQIVDDLTNANYIVEAIEKKEVKKYPLPPFTTSTLQQTAWQKYRYSAKTTMSLAQRLYEEGYITYHRTDSLNLSEMSLFSAKKFITEKYGQNYWAGKPVKYKTKSSSAQEAHEAIRPTYVHKNPELLANELDSKQLKLYTLIWQRFIASQMAPACFNSVSVYIKASSVKTNYTFKSSGQTFKFDGFLKVYPIKFEEMLLPDLKENDNLTLLKLDPVQHFTEPPPRYNEASLIKTLEKYGIGRPSTYAPIISTIQERNYVKKDEQKRFIPTEIGIIVNDVLVKNFPEIVDIDFTAKMEEELDKIAEGKKNWKKACSDFYSPFAENLEKKYKEVKKENFIQKTNKICPQCGSSIVEKMGKFGRFYACSKFPECKYTESIENKNLKIKCPFCKEGEIIVKKTKKGKIFYGCNRFPKCNFALWDKPLEKFCPKCNSILVEKNGKIKCSNEKCNFQQEINN